jgi:hypothetical protein
MLGEVERRYTMEFCKLCQSIKIKDSCTNRKCRNHIAGTEAATFRQVEYIKELAEKLGDETEYDYRNMTMKEASKLIEELEEGLEVEG